MKKADTDLQRTGKCPTPCGEVDTPAIEAHACQMDVPRMAAALAVAEAEWRAGAQGKPLAEVLAAQRRKL